MSNALSVLTTCKKTKQLNKIYLFYGNSSNPYSSVDPAPPDLSSKNNVESLRKILLDESIPLFKRYRYVNSFYTNFNSKLT